MPACMLTPRERGGHGKVVKARILEPFPAFNTTDAFECDVRTAKVLEQIWKKYKLHKKFDLDLIFCSPDEEWAMPTRD